MRPWLLTSLLLATVLAGCFDDIPETPTEEVSDQATEPTTGLRAGNATLYLHSDGAGQWMDADEDATDTALTGSGTAANPPQNIRFTLRPAPERDLVFDGPLLVSLQVHLEPIIGQAPQFASKLFIDGKEVASASDNNPRMNLDTPNWPAGSEIVLEVCVCPQSASVAYGYTFMTDGSSTVTLDFKDADSPAPNGSSTQAGSEGQSNKGSVTVSQENGRWVARRTDTYQESVSVDTANIDLAVPVGDVSISNEGTGSKLIINLGARGDTEQEARNNLSAMTTRYDAGTNNGAFDLTASVQTPNQQWSNQWAHMTLTLSPSNLATLSVDTSTGDINVGTFTGTTWSIDTSTGDIDLSGFTVSDLSIDTSTGDVTLQGTTNDLEIDSSTGDIEATLRATASGTWNIDTSTGDIQINAPSDAQRGYDAAADTSTGDITFDFDDTSPVGEQDEDHKHVRTNGYDSRTIKTKITLETSTADIYAGSN